MAKIIVGFSKPIKFALHAWIIEKIDGAKFDHAYLRLALPSLDREVIYQATSKGVYFVGRTLWLQTIQPVEEYELDITPDNYKTLLQFCIDNSGVPYGFLGVIGAGIVDIAAKCGKTIKNPLVKNGVFSSEFCSEIVTRVLDTVDPVQFNLVPGNITPNDLNTLIKKLGIVRTL
jgi:hypothetical protein